MDRLMKPMEFGKEKKISEVIVAGAFKDALSVLMTEESFDATIQEFMNKKSTN